MANLPAEEPDALMHARPDLWEPWRATARATRSDEAEWESATYPISSSLFGLRHRDTQPVEQQTAFLRHCNMVFLGSADYARKKERGATVALHIPNWSSGIDR